MAGKRKTRKRQASTEVVPRSGVMARRRKANKAISQAALRERISMGNHHALLLKDIDKLEVLRKKLANKKVLLQGEQALYMTQIATLKTKIDARFKLLNKYLPDLRSMEFRDGEDGNPFATAAVAWAEALKQGPSDASNS